MSTLESLTIGICTDPHTNLQYPKKKKKDTMEAYNLKTEHLQFMSNLESVFLEMCADQHAYLKYSKKKKGYNGGIQS